jgi:hypothetical protein
MFLVMPGLLQACPGHPRLCGTSKEDVDGRVKPRHDEKETLAKGGKQQ